MGLAHSDLGPIDLRGIDWVMRAQGQASPCPAGSARAGRGEGARHAAWPYGRKTKPKGS
jgi:hypothetical protein